MGCINNCKIKYKKCTNIIVTNKRAKESNENENIQICQQTNEQIYTFKKIESFSEDNLFQDPDELVNNNPLPFVKIKKK